jgi:hypothetical protein
LQKIIGREAGSLPNYSYSNAMKGADLVWNRATLDSIISNPDQVVPGNNMKPYSGLASAEERAKIIAFLEATAAAERVVLASKLQGGSRSSPPCTARQLVGRRAAPRSDMSGIRRGGSARLALERRR